MNKPIARVFELLHQLRDNRPDYVISLSDSLHGFIQGLFWADVIDDYQFKALSALSVSAFCHSGYPFPSIANAGPVMSSWVAHQRSKHHPKPQAVPANEPVQQQPVAAPRELRLLCLLGKSSTGERIYIPASTLRPLPPLADIQGRWSNVAYETLGLERSVLDASDYSGISLRKAQGVAPSAEVLVRCREHRQAHAFRSAVRSFRAIGVTA